MEEADKKDDGFARISDSMHRSKAWKKLSLQSRCLYMEFKFRYNGKNVNDLSFTYKEGRELMNVNTFAKCIKQLLELGFIKYIRHSPNTRECNIYGLCEDWKRVK